MYRVCKRLAPNRLKHLNSRITARGFFDILSQFPDGLFLLEDVESIFDDKRSWGLLRSALHGQRGRDGSSRRVISWTIADNSQKEDCFSGSREVVFTGQIIIVANTRLDDKPEIKVVADRIAMKEFCLTSQQIQAAMIVLSQKEWKFKRENRAMQVVTAEENEEVTRFLLGEIEKHPMTISLRIWEQSLTDYLAWRDGGLRAWEDRVRNRVEQAAANQEMDGVDRKRLTMRERVMLQEQIIRGIWNETPVWSERLAFWIERTGASQATMYRRLAKMGL